MNSSLQEVWHQVEKLLLDGISVIPVRDKDTGNFVAKSPYRDWKEYQNRIISKEELWKQMEHHNTLAIATICGAVSGNMEVIDIDVKFKPGIDATLFQAIKDMYPDTWARLRVHKSPSGGYHIIYRVEGEPVPGNMKLAGRPATEEELAKSKQKAYNFIETRGEGGYVLFPPSLGYSVAKDVPVPVITWEERCSLINVCKSLTEIIKEEPAYKPTKQDNFYYDENPFEDYNRRCDPVALMQQFGWNFFKENSRFIWFTRPGKDKGISASYNREKRMFFIFTASTELDENRGYHPASLLALYEFNDDKKKCYSWLVTNGYGKVKEKVEKEQLKSKAKKGEPVPENFSEESKKEWAQQQEKKQERYPYGTFWMMDDEDKVTIDREGLYEVADGLGFKLFNQALVQIIGYRIFRREDRFFYDTVKEYIKEEDGDFYRDICNAFEAFIEKHGKFSISRLKVLTNAEILTDTVDTAFKFFQNCYVKINQEEWITQRYEDLGATLIWDEGIQPRDYVQTDPGGLYVDFIHRACVDPFGVRKIIGYLAHQYKDETTGYIIILTEEVPDPKSGGGSGKNLFSKLLQHTTTHLGIPGSQVKYDEKFLQSWNYQKIFAISDVPKKFDYGFLKELSTGVGILKKLYSNETSVPVDLMPKFIIETNYSYEVTDGGLRRRLIPIEFTNFFTLSGGVDVHYGKHFPKDWTTEDWGGYDAFIFKCIQEWLLAGRKLKAVELTHGGWLKQFEQKYQQLTREFIEEHWEYWTRVQWIAAEDFNTDYEKFCVENNVGIRFRLSSTQMNRALAEWSERHKVEFEPNVKKRVDTFQKRGKQFLEDAPF